jgi:hypothetical protein
MRRERRKSKSLKDLIHPRGRWGGCDEWQVWFSTKRAKWTVGTGKDKNWTQHRRNTKRKLSCEAIGYFKETTGRVTRALERKGVGYVKCKRSFCFFRILTSVLRHPTQTLCGVRTTNSVVRAERDFGLGPMQATPFQSATWSWETVSSSCTARVFRRDSPPTRSRGSTGSGGESSSMLTSVEENAVQAFSLKANEWLLTTSLNFHEWTWSTIAQLFLDCHF